MSKPQFCHYGKETSKDHNDFSCTMYMTKYTHMNTQEMKILGFFPPIKTNQNPPLPTSWVLPTAKLVILLKHSYSTQASASQERTKCQKKISIVIIFAEHDQP